MDPVALAALLREAAVCEALAANSRMRVLRGAADLIDTHYPPAAASGAVAGSSAAIVAPEAEGPPDVFFAAIHIDRIYGGPDVPAFFLERTREELVVTLRRNTTDAVPTGFIDDIEHSGDRYYTDDGDCVWMLFTPPVPSGWSGEPLYAIVSNDDDEHLNHQHTAVCLHASPTTLAGWANAVIPLDNDQVAFMQAVTANVNVDRVPSTDDICALFCNIVVRQRLTKGAVA